MGNQRYQCKDCGVTRVLDSRWPTRQLNLAALERSYLERQSWRATGRIFGISQVTARQHLNKKRAALGK